MRRILLSALLMLVPARAAWSLATFEVGTEHRFPVFFKLHVTRCEPSRWVRVQGDAVEALHGGACSHDMRGMFYADLRALKPGTADIQVFEGSGGCGGKGTLLKTLKVLVVPASQPVRAWKPLHVEGRFYPAPRATLPSPDGIFPVLPAAAPGSEAAPVPTATAVPVDRIKLDLGSVYRAYLKEQGASSLCEPKRWAEVEGEAVALWNGGKLEYPLDEGPYVALEAVKTGPALLKLYVGSTFLRSGGCGKQPKELLRTIPLEVVQKASEDAPESAP